jgi:tetratricopeptide (TPR) repeat protein
MTAPTRAASICFAGVLLAQAATISRGSTGSQTETHEALLRQYRRGEFDKAVDGVMLRVASSASLDIAGEAASCFAGARKNKRPDELEAALMLHSEVIFRGWSQGSGSRLGSMSSLSAMIKHLAIVQQAHAALKSMSPKTPFLRRWYLLWESFRQGNLSPNLPRQADYLELGLDEFPEDPELLLAAGSRNELQWWLSASNPQRHRSGDGRSSALHLRTARGLLRKAVDADPGLAESHLRFGRVLALMGDFDDALDELRRVSDTSGDLGLRYLGHLFLGDVHERRGDSGAAAREYQVAIGLVPVSQSARVAAAHLAYAAGLRKESADQVGKALSETSTGADPWWWYIRGQWWHFEPHLQIARSMVVTK